MRGFTKNLTHVSLRLKPLSLLTVSKGCLQYCTVYIHHEIIIVIYSIHHHHSSSDLYADWLTVWVRRFNVSFHPPRVTSYLHQLWFYQSASSFLSDSINQHHFYLIQSISIIISIWFHQIRSAHYDHCSSTLHEGIRGWWGYDFMLWLTL